MPDVTTTAKALADAGGWAAFLALVIVIGIVLYRGKYVHDSVYQREVKRGDDATSALTAIAKSVDALTDEVRWESRDRQSVKRGRDATT